MAKPLAEYRRKRDFKRTAEPEGGAARASKRPSRDRSLMFVVQEHHASHLHYDFRLELDGVLKSWAVPKGPSPDPSTKRLAMEVEDHPLEYGKFEGEIPADEYGGGEVLIWDTGTWQPESDARAAIRKGRLDFGLKGSRMKGRWSLIRTRPSGSRHQWLLFKRHDRFAGDARAFGPLRGYGSRAERPKDSPRSTRAWAPQGGKRGLAAAARPTKARESAPPAEFIAPQLPLLVEVAPTGAGWVHEMKFDGYRTQARIDSKPGKSIRLTTRNRLDWTAKYPRIVAALKGVRAKSAILDGEIVAIDGEGRSDFGALQAAMKEGGGPALRYYVFDLLHLNGVDLRERPLLERKELLKVLLAGSKAPLVEYSDHIEGGGKEFLALSCRQDLEGIVSKRADSPYVSGRGALWVKSKCQKRQEFVIGGYTDPAGHRGHFGALLLGVCDGDRLRYVGRCGTGFDHETLRAVLRQLKRHDTDRSPFDLKSPRGRDIHWVKPKLVAEAGFAMWTRDGMLRAPVFKGLRDDKPARQIGREEPALTHPDKVIFGGEKITKLRLAEYYGEVAPWLLPWIADRPLSLMRCPEGSKAPCFFQKHLAHLPTTAGGQSALHEVKIREAGGTKGYVTIDSQEGLVSLVQMGAYEIHAWGCRQPDVEHPDQVVMDFDPAPDVSLKQVKAAALELRKTLLKLGLQSFLKVTGGKGLHVHIPIAPIYTWDQVKKLAHVLADEMVSRRPDLYTATMAKSARRGKIFIDYLRNGRSATAVIPYAVRARATSAVAMPIDWSELAALKSPSQFTLAKALAHLRRRKQDPWAGMAGLEQRVKILDSR